jgi:predicted Zn finger-like uncharacterized protein
MKIVCDACGTKYSISDDRVAGKVFKIRCKKCSQIIVVRGGQASEPVAAPVEAAAVGEWHVVIDGQQSGPFERAELLRRHAAGEVDDDSYVWRDGMDEWAAFGAVAELADGTTRTSAAAIDAASPPDAYPASASVFSTSARSASNDVFATGAAHEATHASAPETARTDAKLVAERNENSVLFTLGNLAKLASPAPTANPTKPGAAGIEGSGLIDIRQLASTYATKPARSASAIGSMDDLPTFAPTTFGEPIVMMPAAAARGGDRRLMYALFVALAMLAIVASILLVVMLRRDTTEVAGTGSDTRVAQLGEGADGAGGTKGSTANGAGANGSTADGSTAGGSTGNSSNGNGSTANGSTANGSTTNGSTTNGSTASGSMAGGSSSGGPTADGATANGATANGSTGNSSSGTTNGSTNGATANGSTTNGSRPSGSTTGSTAGGSMANGSTANGSRPNGSTTGSRPSGSTTSSTTGSRPTGSAASSSTTGSRPTGSTSTTGSRPTGSTSSSTGSRPTGSTAPDKVQCEFSGYADKGCEIYRPATSTTVNSNLPDNLDRNAIAAGLGTIKAQGCGARSSSRGDVSVQIKVNAEGGVSGVTIKSSPDPVLSQCVSAAVQKGSFAKTKRGSSFGYVWRF